MARGVSQIKTVKRINTEIAFKSNNIKSSYRKLINTKSKHQ